MAIQVAGPLRRSVMICDDPYRSLSALNPCASRGTRPSLGSSDVPPLPLEDISPSCCAAIFFRPPSERWNKWRGERYEGDANAPQGPPRSTQSTAHYCKFEITEVVAVCVCVCCLCVYVCECVLVSIHFGEKIAVTHLCGSRLLSLVLSALFFYLSTVECDQADVSNPLISCLIF